MNGGTRKSPGWPAGAQQGASKATLSASGDTLSLYRAQRIVASHHVRPGAAMVPATLAYGGEARP